jgi:hypothetical protein
MNWEAIGAIGELIGAVAVVITLVYLAVQIRQNTMVSRAATRQKVAQMAMAAGSDVAINGDLAELLVRDLEGKEITPAQRLRLFARLYVALRHWENIHYQHLIGMLSKDEWRGFRLNLKALFEWKTTQTYWKNERSFYSSAFQDEITTIQKEVASSNEDPRHDYVLGNRSESHD